MSSNTTLPQNCSTAPSGNTSSRPKQSPPTYDPPINPYQIIYHPSPYNGISINYQLFTSKSMDSTYHKFKYPHLHAGSFTVSSNSCSTAVHSMSRSCRRRPRGTLLTWLRMTMRNRRRCLSRCAFI